MVQDLEQIFSRQEQAVVYLFSRYWQRIPQFKNKKISRIHTHFPDFSILDLKGNKEAIEFEYGLIDFRSHVGGNDLKNLYKKGIRRLYIVYWEHNDDKAELLADIRKEARFDVIYVCLKDSFQAGVREIPGMDGLQTFWKFSDTNSRRPKMAYRRSDIVEATKKLGSSVKSFNVDKKLCRAIGFNTKNSQYIDCDHLEQIRFFTTTSRFAQGRIPGRLLFKSSGCKYFNGYFNVENAFEVITANKSVRNFVAKYYFNEWAQDIGAEKCFVGEFRRMSYEQGKELYDFMVKKGYRLNVRGSIMVKERDINAINEIINYT